MGHSYNNGLHTSSKGITVDAVRVGAINTAAPVITEDCKSGLITSVAHVANSGIFTFQLSAPYPPKLVICQPYISSASVTTDLLHARYVYNSYNATTGQFQVVVSDDDDAGAPIAATDAAITASADLHVFLQFNRYTR